MPLERDSSCIDAASHHHRPKRAPTSLKTAKKGLLLHCIGILVRLQSTQAKLKREGYLFQASPQLPTIFRDKISQNIPKFDRQSPRIVLNFVTKRAKTPSKRAKKGPPPPHFGQWRGSDPLKNSRHQNPQFVSGKDFF